MAMPSEVSMLVSPAHEYRQWVLDALEADDRPDVREVLGAELRWATAEVRRRQEADIVLHNAIGRRVQLLSVAMRGALEKEAAREREAA